jgi:hypothetical protein
MLIKLFRNLTDYKWFFAFAILFLLFIPYSFIEKNIIINSLLVKTNFHELINFKYGILSLTIVIVVFILCYILFFNTLISNKIVPYQNYLSLLFAVSIFSVWHPLDFFSLEELLIVIFFILFILKIFVGEGSNTPHLKFFDAGLMISIISIINLNFLIFYLLIFFSLFIFRIFHWQIWASAIVGLILPHVFLNSYYFLFFDKTFYNEILISFFNQISYSTNFFYLYPFHWIIFVSIYFISIIKTFSNIQHQKINIRKKNIIFIWIIIFLLLILPLQNTPFFVICFISSALLGYFISNSFKRLFERRFFIIFFDILIFTLICLNITSYFIRF